MADNWFFQTGLMDVLRTLLVFGLLFAIWELPAPGLIQRPVRDFVHWGLRYPFLFLVMAAVTLIVWGVLGADYGLQILLLHDHPLVQYQLGIAMSLLVLGINFHYFVLDTSSLGWRQSLELTIRVYRGLNGLLPAGRPIHTVLHNGFLEYLWPDDLERIETALDIARHRDLNEEGNLSWWQRILNEVRKPMFRVLFAPAVLMVNAIPVVVLLGVITSIGDFPRRWPWLLGVLTGVFGAVVLACYTSRWLSVAKEWNNGARDLRQLLSTADNVEGRSENDRSGRLAENLAPSIERRLSPYVIAFFAVHAIVFGFPPVDNWQLDTPRPGDTDWPWSALAILVKEALAAFLIVWAWRLVLSPLINWTLPRIWRWLLGGLETRPRLTDRRSLPWWIGLGVIAISGCLAWGWNRAGRPEIGVALVAMALMALFLLNWLICFFLAASYDLRPSATGRMNPLIVGCTAAIGILGILLHSCGMYQEAGFCGAPAILIGVFGISESVGVTTTRQRLLTRGAWLVIGLIAFVGLLWKEYPVPTSTWLMFGILSVAAFALSAVARSDRPAMIYPASAIFTYISFSIFYNSLPEGTQALLPAGASLIVLLGLAASAYMVIKFSHPRYALVGCLGITVGFFAINGNAWQVDPNHFKLQFPNLEAYYHNRLDTRDRGHNDSEGGENSLPIWLDTRAYVRSTVSAIVKLRHADLEQEQNLQSNQADTEKLGSVNYTIIKGKAPKEIYLGITDTRGRFRAAPGDSIYLTLPDRSFDATRANGPGTPWNLSQAVPDSPCQEELLNEFASSSGMIRVWYNPADGKGVGLLYSRFDNNQHIKECYGIKRGKTIVLELHGTEEKTLPPTVSVACIFEGQVVDRVGEKQQIFDAMVRLEGSRGIKEIIERYPTLSESPAQAGTKQAITEGESEFQRLIEESHLILERPEYPIDRSKPLSEPALRSAVKEILKPSEGDSINVVDRSTEWPVVLDTFFQPTADSAKVDAPPDHLVLNSKFLNSLGLTPTGKVTSDREWTLQLIPSPNDVNSIPATGKSSVIVFDLDRVLHFRIFDNDGTRIVDTSEKKLTDKASAIEDLKEQLKSLWNRPNLPKIEVDRVIASVTSIVGQRYFLRVAHDRGMFRATELDGSLVSLYRGERVRKDDRLILRWRDSDTGLQHSRVALVTVEQNGPKQGSNTFQLVSWPPDGLSKPLWTKVPVAGTWQLARPLENLEVLNEWKRGLSTSARPKSNDPQPKPFKPPLVIITVSGGGIRSSVWTSTVLKTLEEQLGPNFPYHIRLITGASGGMVAAAHYAASLQEPPSLPIRRDAAPRAESGLADDQLSAVAGCLVFNDLPGMLNPIQRHVDRGRKMEETWSRLTKVNGKSAFDMPLRGLIADELAGWRPSLVFTPMLVEDGRRLLISNLDLSFVARNSGRILLEQESE